MRAGASRRVLLALGSLALALLVAEGVLRIDHAGKRREVLAGRGEADLVTRAVADGRIYGLRPGVAGVTNSRGFRDVERSRRKQPGTCRLALVGDSVAMQLTIPFEELYFRHLQRLLDQSAGTPGEDETGGTSSAGRPDRVEVLNLGVTGYGAGQEVVLLEREVLGFEPDAVLWQFHHNDAADPVIDGANGGLGLYYDPSVSALGRFVRRRATHLHRRGWERRRGLGEVPPDLRQQLYAWERMGGHLRRLRELAGARGIPVLVFVVPSWPRSGGWEVYDGRGGEIHERLVERFREAGFPTLDLLPALRRLPPDRFRAAPDDPWHPSAEGHRWIGERLAEWLEPLLPEVCPDRSRHP